MRLDFKKEENRLPDY